MPSRNAVTFEVFVNGTLAPELEPVLIHRSTGGGRLDHAVLRENFDKSESRSAWEDWALDSGIDSEILIKGRRADGQAYLYHWGKLAINRMDLGQRTEASTLVSQVQPWHFGQPIRSQIVYNPSSEAYTTVHRPVLFNPYIDGRLQGNRRKERMAINGGDDPYVFLDPESTRTKNARELQKSDATLWTLRDVVEYLCIAGNVINGVSEKHILNPTAGQLAQVFGRAGDPSPDLVRHLHLRDGLFLPQALDAVLEPFGYAWHLTLDVTKTDKPQIAIFKRGKGTGTNALYLQPRGSMVDPEQSSLAEAEIEFDIANLYNAVMGQGSFIEVESTFELQRAWPEDKDEKADTPDELYRNGTEAVELRDVWRKWVLNEAGDYSGLRKDKKSSSGRLLIPGIKKAYDFALELSELASGEDQTAYEKLYVPRRMRFLPTLTMAKLTNDRDDEAPAGQVDGCKVEYWNENTDANGEPEGWTHIVEPCRILVNECGVMFDGQHPPIEIMRQGDLAKVRVTATVRFDLRTSYQAAKQKTSINGELVPLYIDLSDRFHLRKVSKYSALFGGQLTAREDDDRKQLKSYCDRIRDAWDLATINGPATLEGIDRWGYQLGQRITGINGRGVSFSGSGKPGNNADDFPTITAITYDVLRQQTILLLEHARTRKGLLDDMQGFDTR